MKLTMHIPAILLGAVLAASAPALAQTSPAPVASPEPAMTMAPAPVETSAPTQTSAPQEQPHPKIKTLKRGSLSLSQMTYGLTHPAQELKALRQIKKISFDNIRIVKVNPLLRTRLHLRAQDDVQMLALDNVFALQDAMLAQTNGSNSPIANLQNVLANINVSNALNNILNGSTVNVGVSLADVLNGNKIAISQVLGVYVNGFSFINTIVK